MHFLYGLFLVAIFKVDEISLAVNPPAAHRSLTLVSEQHTLEIKKTMMRALTQINATFSPPLSDRV